MLPRYVTLTALAAMFAGCSAMGQLTVKDYQAKSGQRVMAGQAAPKAAYGCNRLAEQKHAWGMAGTMNRVSAQERLTAEAIESASSRGANYAHVIPPSDTSVGGININAAKDAQVAYYTCAALPASK